MNEQELLKSMNGISDEMLLRSEKNILAVKPDARARRRKYAGYSAIAAGILIAVIFILVINSRKISATNLMDGVEPNALLARATPEEYGPVVTDFAARLFRECYKEGENQLISPVSVISALGMTANGAAGETLKQMEDVLGADIETLNKYLYSFAATQNESWQGKLSIANSIWFDEGRLKKVEEDFLQKNADYYGADIYKLTFDSKAKKDINRWVSRKTDGMIEEVIEGDISEKTVMFLINALSFDAEWVDAYRKSSVRDGDFTLEDGTKKNVSFMFSVEGTYLEDEDTTGFLKYYKGCRYAFAALLPKEGIKLSDYVSSLDGDKISNLLKNKSSDYRVDTKTPKFSTDYSLELKDILGEMGMRDAFSFINADFSSLGQPIEENLYIDSVFHKTFIQVDERGTKAGAVTAVAPTDSGAPMKFENVYLDRPFVYMLIDCESNIPLFIGTLADIE